MEMVEGLNNQYIRINLPEEKEEGMEGYRSRILQKNKIATLIRMDRRHIDGRSYFYFDITGLQSLKHVFESEPVTVEKMNALVDSLEETLQKMEEYLLVQKELCLKPEYIMLDQKNDRWHFLYVPDYKERIQADIEELLEFIIDKADSEKEEDLERFYDFFNEVLKNTGEMTPKQLVRLWDKGEFKNENSKRVASEKVQVMSEPIKLIDASLSMPGEGPKHRGRIYTVPYHGIKVNRGQEVSLT